MSETLAVALANVQELLRDTDPNAQAVDPMSAYHVIVSKAQELGNRAGFGTEWVAGAFTLTVGSLADHTLPSSIQYHQVLSLRIAETGRELERWSLDGVNRMRDGLLASQSGGDPCFFALYEDSSQAVKVRFNLAPSIARTIDILRSAFNASTYTAATVLPFADSFLRVIEKAAALECLAMLSKEEVARLGISKDVGALWAADVARGVLDEQARKSRLVTGPRMWRGRERAGTV